MAPRSTLAVKCWTLPLRLNPKSANRAARNASPARTSQLRFGWKRAPVLRPITLLITERFDRIEPGGFSSRVVSEEHSHSDGEKRRDHHGFHRHLEWPAQRLANEIRGSD